MNLSLSQILRKQLTYNAKKHGWTQPTHSLSTFHHLLSLVSWEIFVWTHKKKINSRHLTHSISTKDSLGPDEPSMA